MLETILQDFADLMKVRVLEISAEFEKNLDFSALEIAITQELAILGAALQKNTLTVLLVNAVFLFHLRVYAGKAGLRFKE